MAEGFGSAGANTALDALVAAYPWIKLHTGAPSFKQWVLSQGSYDLSRFLFLGRILPEELADIVLYCWKLPPHICIRDIVVTPTRTTF